MARSFINVAGKRVTDVREFLRDAAGGNSIKYVAERGKKHLIYFPYENIEEVEDGQTVVKKSIIAISGGIHEWKTVDGRYRATVCPKGKVIKSDDGETIINDGSCPICDRVQDAWEISRYRKEAEESLCTLTGEEREKHLKTCYKEFMDERKAKDVREYLYILVALIRLDGTGSVIIGQNGIPEYDLKVMKMQASRIEKMIKQLVNSGMSLPGSEIVIEYADEEDRRLRVSQSTTAPIYAENKMTVKFPALLESINRDVKKFKFDGIEKAFLEWAGMSTLECKKLMDESFEMWDKYKKELAVNPNAKYLEYVTSVKTNNPSITGVVSGEATQAVPQAVPQAAPVIPNIPDINSIFGSNNGGGTVTP